MEKKNPKTNLLETKSFSTKIYTIETGIEIIYNTIHNVHPENTLPEGLNFVELNYCKEGKFECEFNTNSIGYVNQGDFAINMYNNPSSLSAFPLGYYIGITILINLDTYSPIQQLPNGVEINLASLWRRYCHLKSCFILRNDLIIQSIFDFLYLIPMQMRANVHLLKWWELLLYLNNLDGYKKELQNTYLPHKQVQCMKEVETFLTENIERHITINELAKHFYMSPTTLKEHFQYIFGKPIFTYMKEYRCHCAAIMLSQSDLLISTIAEKVGYTNASKFSAAFSSLYGLTPSAYRKEGMIAQ